MPEQGQIARQVRAGRIAHAGDCPAGNDLGEAAVPGDLHIVAGWIGERDGGHIPGQAGAQVLV